MLSRSGRDRRALVCSDCGAPVPGRGAANGPHPLISALVLLALGAFSLLLFLLTSGRPEPQQARERSLVRRIASGELVREAGGLEGGGEGETTSP